MSTQSTSGPLRTPPEAQDEDVPQTLSTNEPHIKPIQLLLPLPTLPASNLHIHLTPLAHTTLLLLTTDPSHPPPLGSFVCAFPPRNGKQPLSTPLYIRESSVEVAGRLARVIATKTGKPAYVGWSGSPEVGTGMGVGVEEEVKGWKRVVSVVMDAIEGRNGEGKV